MCDMWIKLLTYLPTSQLLIHFKSGVLLHNEIILVILVSYQLPKQDFLAFCVKY